MLMRSGDLWHCTNHTCRAELCVGPGEEVEVDHVYCACGAVMSKHDLPPAFSYLDFLGDRKIQIFDARPAGIFQDVRKDRP